MPDIEDQPTAVYRLYARDGRLLYVGMTNNPDVRFAYHALTKRWWQQVEGQSVEWHTNRSAARQAEAEAIKAERPVHNAMHAAAGPNDVPLREVRGRLNAIVEGARDRGEHHVITYFGRPQAVVVGPEFFEEAARNARILAALREVAPDVLASFTARS
ncbi:GIY-YIG nuclease family protein [Streptomyces sp. G6]|uniref:GIY-YIG nuclease family protein n=1 Tax=Streptomyces sp. G6 TaxID=1178736 RepID=UPI003ED84A6F